MSNDIVDLLQSDLLMLLLAEEDGEVALEDACHFDPDGQYDHRHDEWNEGSCSLTPYFAFIRLLNLGDPDEELLQVVRVEKL